MTEAIRDRDYCKELLDAMVEDYDEMGRAYEAELATLRAELKKKSQDFFSHEGRVYSADLT